MKKRTKKLLFIESRLFQQAYSKNQKFFASFFQKRRAFPDCKPVIVSADERQRESWSNTERGNASWFTLFSSDMTPTTAMSAGIMEVPPNGGVLQPHRHRQAEIYFVHEGVGSLTINGVETTITVGTAAFIPGDAEHSVRNHSATLLRLFYVFPTDGFADVVYRFPG